MSIDAMKHYEAALKAAFPQGAFGEAFEHWNQARLAIEQAERQEPVCEYCGGDRFIAPPQRQPLTEEEIKVVIRAGEYDSMEEFARAIERAHGIGGGE